MAQQERRPVWVVEKGEWSDRSIDAIFTTRELADEWVERCYRQQWEFEQQRMNSSDPAVRRFMASPYKGWTFEQFKDRDDGNACGDVQEYDLWDVLPVHAPQD